MLTMNDLQEACNHMLKVTRIAVDCEGVSLSATGRLCLIQVAVPTTSKELVVYIIDVVALATLDGEVFRKDGVPDLKKIFENNNITKVLLT